MVYRLTADGLSAINDYMTDGVDDTGEFGWVVVGAVIDTPHKMWLTASVAEWFDFSVNDLIEYEEVT